MALSKLDYVEVTSDVACTASTEGTANTVITSNSVSVDGSTQIAVRFCISGFEMTDATTVGILWLYEDGASIGRIWDSRAVAANVATTGFTVERRLTPTNGSHTYSVRGSVNPTGATFTLKAGAGGSGTRVPLALLIISEG